jgi:hypothetical protein
MPTAASCWLVAGCSCNHSNPAALARDAALLSPNLEIGAPVSAAVSLVFEDLACLSFVRDIESPPPRV